jgi:hypothetical protein
MSGTSSTTFALTMSWSRLLAWYGWIVALREWQRCRRVSSEVRVGVGATAGAVIAPFVVFVSPVARLYWLITGRRLPPPLGWLFPPPHILVNPFPADERPPEIRALLEPPGYDPEPGAQDIPPWLKHWVFFGQVLRWEIPGLRGSGH